MEAPNHRQVNKDKDFKDSAMEYYRNITGATVTYSKEISVNRDLAIGRLEEKSYTHVLYPLGKEQKDRDDIKSYPSKLRNYPIIPSVLSVLMGERIERRIKNQVVALNSDIDSKREKALRDVVKQNAVAGLHEEMRQQGIDPEVSPEAQSIQEAKKQIDSIPDYMSLQGEKSLKFINRDQEISRKLRKSWYDWISVGFTFSYRDIYKDEVVYESIAPERVTYLCSDEIDFIEDGEAVRVEYEMTDEEIEDRFEEEVKDMKSQKSLDSARVYFGRDGDFFSGSPDSDSRRHSATNRRQVYHLVFRSKRKVGNYLVKDLVGNVVDRIKVDHTFKPRSNEEVEWFWEDQIWEGWDIPDVGYVGVRPIPMLVGDNAKLPYNGRVNIKRTGSPECIPSIGKSYQEMYNIIKYHLEKVIAKFRDQVLMMPIGLIPESRGVDMFKWLYYLDALGVGYIDEQNPKAMQALQAIKSIGSSLSNYIQYLYEMADKVKGEFKDLIGITRQREGQINSSDSVRNTEASLYRSAVITEEMFLSFDEFIERDFNRLLELSRYAWSEGKEMYFINDDNYKELLKVLPEDIPLSAYSVFVVNTKEEREKLEMLRSQAQAFAQNGSTPSTIGKIIKSTSFNEILEELEKKEFEAMKQIEAQNERQNQMSEQEIADKQADREFEMMKHQDQLALKYHEVNTKYNDSIKNMIQSGEKLTDSEILNNIQKTFDDSLAKFEEFRTKRYVSQNNLKIAKENKNKYDK